MSEVCRDCQVFVDEIGRVGRVRVDAANFCRRDDDCIRLISFEEIEDFSLGGEIEIGAGGCKGFDVQRGSAADKCGANHTAVA